MSRWTRQFQQFGLTVAEVIDALASHDVGGATCTSERWRLEQIEARIEAQLAELRRTRRLMREALTARAAGLCRLAAAVADGDS